MAAFGRAASLGCRRIGGYGFIWREAFEGSLSSTKDAIDDITSFLICLTYLDEHHLSPRLVSLVLVGMVL